MDYQIHGIEEIKSKLSGLTLKVQKQYVRKAGRECLKGILAEARANAPVKTGLIRRSLRIAGGKGKKGSISLSIVMGLKNYVGKSYYGAFVEQGHFTGKRPSGLKGIKGPDAREKYHAASLAIGRKFIPGQHFMLHAYESGKENAVDVFGEKLGELIKAGQ